MQEAYFIQEQVTLQPKVDTINYFDPLEDSESDKGSDIQLVISIDFYFVDSDDKKEPHGAILMTSDASDTYIHPLQSFESPVQMEQLELAHVLLTCAAQDQV